EFLENVHEEEEGKNLQIKNNFHENFEKQHEIEEEGEEEEEDPVNEISHIPLKNADNLESHPKRENNEKEHFEEVDIREDQNEEKEKKKEPITFKIFVKM